MRIGVHGGVDYLARDGLRIGENDEVPYGTTTISRDDEEACGYIAGRTYLGGGGTLHDYGVQFPIRLLSTDAKTLES